MQKAVLITGANRGLGLGFVKYFLEVGYKVFAGTRNTESFPDLKSANLFIIKLDMSNDDSIKEAIKEISMNTNQLDFLINNAGVNKDSVADDKSLVSDLENLDRQILLKMFDINSISPAILTKYALPLLQRSKLGYVINISSCRASFKDEHVNSSANYGYRASKAALNMMTFASIHDLPENIRTFSVHPGNVKSDMNPWGETEPVEAAKQIIQITGNWKDDYNGNFLRFSGEEYPR